MYSDDERGPSGFLTVRQAAGQLRYSERRVRQLLKDRVLQGHKVDGGRKWLISKEQIDRLSYAGGGPDEPGTAQQHGDNLHQKELKSLLSKWLESEEEVTLELWLNNVTDCFVSPSGLLTWAQDALRFLGRDPMDQPSPCSTQDARESLLAEYAPQRAMQAPPSLIGSSLFPSLRQHLSGDVLWEQWTSVNEARASLAAHVWTRAMYLFRFTLGLLSAEPGDTQHALSKIQLVTEDPANRDQVSQYLKTAIYLLGSDLIRRGVQECELFPSGNGGTYILGRMMQEAEDQLQRLQVPEQWVLPKAGAIREIARQIWDGSLGEDLSQNLGQEAVCDLIKLWQECSQASEVSRIRLKTVIATRPFPGSCPECPEL